MTSRLLDINPTVWIVTGSNIIIVSICFKYNAENKYTKDVYRQGVKRVDQPPCVRIRCRT